MSARSSLIANLALLGGSLLLGLLIGEAFLRLYPRFLPEEARLRLHWGELTAGEARSIPHPYIGFLYPPHAQGHVESRDLAFSYTTDEHGFRNPSPWPARAEIVCVGNSLVFGFGVSDDEVWPRLLAEGPPARQVVNLGLAGTAPQQYVRIYEVFGVPLQPRLLIFGLFPGNDVADAGLFEDWLNAGSPGNYDVWRFFRGRLPQQGRGLIRRSYLITTVSVMVRGLASPFSGETVELAGGGRLQLAPGVIARNAAGANPSHPHFKLTMRAIEEARDLARREGTGFMVVLFPTKEEVYLPVLGKTTPRLVAPFVEELRQRGIPFLDLTPHLQERARTGEKLFFEVDGHPNAAGNRVIADVLREHLSRNPGPHALRSPAAP